MPPLEPQGWLTLVALVGMFIVLIKEWVSADMALFATLLLLWSCGVVDAKEATAGFSSPQVLTVGLLFVVAAAMKDTGALSRLTRHLLGEQKRSEAVLARLLLPTAAMSAFLNNTPIVAMLTPEIRAWSQSQRLPASRFLMPLSFAAILGGTCTLIGTSTNLLVSGLMEQHGLEPLAMFELAWVGIPATIVGLVYLTLVAPRLLPDREAPGDPLGDTEPEYSVRLEVAEGSALVGKSVEAAGLRHLDGLFLVEIDRAGRRIVPVRPSNLLEAGDQLVLVGVASSVSQLVSFPGLDPVSDDDEAVDAQAIVHEIVIPTGSPLVGRNLREINFRRRYDAAVVAIHRGGQRLHQKLGDVELRPGDTLMVMASGGFRVTWASTRDFILLEARAEPSRRGLLALVILVTMVIVMGSGTVSTLLAAGVAAVALVLTGCIPAGRARGSVDLSVLLLMASSFGLSAAVENSGLAAVMASTAVSIFGQWSPLVALVAVYLLCAVVTEALSNTAAAALVFPVALTLAGQMGLDPRPFAVVVAVAASMSFLTPLGYQTNLLVYGPGGYRFSDFTRVGFPLSLLIIAVAVPVIGLVYGLWSV